jgi:hypothetical protein
MSGLILTGNSARVIPVTTETEAAANELAESVKITVEGVPCCKVTFVDWSTDCCSLK